MGLHIGFTAFSRLGQNRRGLRRAQNILFVVFIIELDPQTATTKRHSHFDAPMKGLVLVCL